MDIVKLLQSAGIADLVELRLPASPSGNGERLPGYLSEIHTITDDSREAGPGVLYVATPQGISYVYDAVRAGSRLLLVPEEMAASFREGAGAGDWPAGDAPGGASEDWRGIGLLVAKDLFRVQGRIASTLNGNPSEKLHLVGITGTNGKTSTAWMLYHIWKSAGIRGAMIGTLGVRYTSADGTEVARKTGYTTPRAPLLQKLLGELVEAGVTHAALEVSSEALALGRLEGCRFSTAVFTNLTPDHLDAHGDMESYFQEKMKLFRMTAGSGGRILVYTAAGYGDRALAVARSLSPHNAIAVESPIVPEDVLPTLFHRINGSLAILASSPDEAAQGHAMEALRNLPPVPGRFNIIPFPGQGDATSLPSRFAVVDYAHTPDALENLLSEARRMGVKSLLCVFGCGGNRDRGKRPLMGEIAARLSDRVIITDDNPRREDPASIRREIGEGATKARGLPATGETVQNIDRREAIIEISDRRRAIREGVRWVRDLPEEALPGAVVVAGKGHETVQIFADHTEDFSDTEEVGKALEA